MHFRHSSDIWSRFPSLVPMVLSVEGVTPDANVDAAFERLLARAKAHLAAGAEGESVPIQAWRRGFSAMGLKPTQYRCAAEALLRRLRKDGQLPRLHPLVDLCNALSVAWALPVAVLDLDGIEGDLTVRAATGSEEHLEFSGAVEHPEPGEVIFADAGNRTHARRWCHRQSARSVIQPQTTRALIVVEALHEGAPADVQAAIDDLVACLTQAGMRCSAAKLLRPGDPDFAC
ncbi:MAG: phenylalanine--tRNA ligase beta subunit-related protein [Pseudomonadota bacterium]|jgi:DNA/RNA-binding domain of Phe-tRNA-synthetase-like protein